MTVRLVGLGSGGARIVDAMPGDGRRISKLLVDTDRFVLASTKSQQALLIGRRTTGGWGCGRDVRLGEEVVTSELGNILDSVFPADVVFLVACFGGGTGSAAARILAGELGRTSTFRVLVAVEPFRFEGQDTVVLARKLTRMAAEQCDASLVVPNALTAKVYGEKATLHRVITKVNTAVRHALRGLCSVMLSSGEVRLGLGQVRSLLKGGVYGSLGVGQASGSDRISKAFRLALTSSFVEPEHVEQARDIIVGISSGQPFGLGELQEGCDEIRQELGLQRVRLGVGRTEGLSSKALVTVIPLGFDPYGALGLVAAGPVAEATEGPLGIFEKQTPTMLHNVNLDVPTFIRKLSSGLRSGAPAA